MKEIFTNRPKDKLQKTILSFMRVMAYISAVQVPISLNVIILTMSMFRV